MLLTALKQAARRGSPILIEGRCRTDPRSWLKGLSLDCLLVSSSYSKASSDISERGVPRSRLLSDASR